MISQNVSGSRFSWRIPQRIGLHISSPSSQRCGYTLCIIKTWTVVNGVGSMNILLNFSELHFVLIQDDHIFVLRMSFVQRLSDQFQDSRQTKIFVHKLTNFISFCSQYFLYSFSSVCKL